MKPSYDKVLVELVGEEGVFQTHNDEYALVKVITMPKEPENAPPHGLKEGAIALCDFIKDYLVEDKKIYVINFKDVILVL